MPFNPTDYNRAFAAWWPALADFKNGNPAPLANLLRSGPAPEVVRQKLADTIAAAPLKRPRNADKAKLTTAQRQRVADKLAGFNTLWGRLDTDDIADELRMEPQEVVACVATLRSRLLAELSKETGLKPDTIRKLHRGK